MFSFVLERKVCKWLDIDEIKASPCNLTLEEMPLKKLLYSKGLITKFIGKIIIENREYHEVALMKL